MDKKEAYILCRRCGKHNALTDRYCTDVHCGADLERYGALVSAEGVLVRENLPDQTVPESTSGADQNADTGASPGRRANFRKWLAVLAAVLALVAIISLWGALADATQRAEQLLEDYSTAMEDLAALQSNYDSLAEQHRQLQEDLADQKRQLQEALTDQQRQQQEDLAAYDDLNAKYQELRQKYESLDKEHNELKSDHESLKERYEDAMDVMGLYRVKVTDVFNCDYFGKQVDDVLDIDTLDRLQFDLEITAPEKENRWAASLETKLLTSGEEIFNWTLDKLGEKNTDAAEKSWWLRTDANIKTSGAYVLEVYQDGYLLVRYSFNISD